MKKMLILTLALLIMTCGGTFALNKMRSNALRSQIAALPGEMTASEVKADLFGNGLEIHGLKGTLTYFKHNPVHVSADFIRLEGLNLNAAQQSGQVKAADKILLRGLSLKFDYGVSGPMGYEEMHTGEMRLNGLWLDVQAFAAAAEKRIDSPELMTALLSLRFGQSVTRDFTGKLSSRSLSAQSYNGMRYTVNVAHAEMEPCTMTEYGATRLRDVQYAFENGTKLDMGELTIASGRMPEQLYSLAFDLENQAAVERDMLEALAGEGLRLDALQAGSLTLTLPEADPIKIAALDADLTLSNEDLHVALKLKDASLPSSLVGLLADEPELYATVLEDRTFVFNSRHDLRFKAGEQDRLEISYEEEVQEKELGSLNHASAFSGLQGREIKSLPDANSALALEKASLRLEDKGLLQILFDLLGADLAKLTAGSMTAQEAGRFLRTQQMTEIRALPLPEGSPMAALRDNLAALLEGPGVLSVKLEPEQPLPLMPLLENPAAIFTLPVQSSFAPAESEAQ